MRVELSQLSLGPEGLEVLAHSAYGTFKALWLGPEPTLNQPYLAELSLQESFCWGEDDLGKAPEDATPGFSLSPEGQSILIVTLEHRYEDGAAVVRLGPHLLTLELHGEIPETLSHLELHLSYLPCLTDTGEPASSPEFSP